MIFSLGAFKIKLILNGVKAEDIFLHSAFFANLRKAETNVGRVRSVTTSR